MQFFYTVSSFLHIVIRHNVDFCKNEPRFVPLIIVHLNCILLLMMKMNKKQFLFHSWKIRAEGRSPLSWPWLSNYLSLLQRTSFFKRLSKILKCNLLLQTFAMYSDQTGFEIHTRFVWCYVSDRRNSLRIGRICIDLSFSNL